jgi:hypothetical protein
VSTPTTEATPSPAPAPTDHRLIHALCEICYPRGAVMPGQVVVALCGDVDAFDRWANATDAPARDCVVCVEIVASGLAASSCDHSILGAK